MKPSNGSHRMKPAAGELRLEKSIGRIGALAVMLGVGVSLGSPLGCGIARADGPDSTSSSSDASTSSGTESGRSASRSPARSRVDSAATTVGKTDSGRTPGSASARRSSQPASAAAHEVQAVTVPVNNGSPVAGATARRGGLLRSATSTNPEPTAPFVPTSPTRLAVSPADAAMPQTPTLGLQAAPAASVPATTFRSVPASAAVPAAHAEAPALTTPLSRAANNLWNFLSDNPAGPVESPLGWAVLAWSRRQSAVSPAEVVPVPNEAPTAVDDGPFAANADGVATFAYARLVGNDTDPDLADGESLVVTDTTALGGTVVNNPADARVTYTRPAIVLGTNAWVIPGDDFAVDATEDEPAKAFTVAKGGSITLTYAQLLDNDVVFQAAGFTYRAMDPEGATSANTATVAVPLAESGVAAGLTIGAVSTPVGTVVNNAVAKTITYTPPEYYSGRVTFDYQVRDSSGQPVPVLGSGAIEAIDDKARVFIDIKPAEAVIIAENLNLGDIAFSPDGTRIYATGGRNDVRIYDAATLDQLPGGFNVSGTGAMAVTPDGLAYGVDFPFSPQSGVTVRDAVTGDEIDQFPGLGPAALADNIPLPGADLSTVSSIFVRDGSAYLIHGLGSNGHPETATIIDLATKAVAYDVPFNDVPAEFPGYAVGNGRIYRVDRTNHTLEIVNPVTNKVVQRVDLAAELFNEPVDVILTPDRKQAWVRNSAGTYVVLALTAPASNPNPNPDPGPAPTPDPAPAPDDVLSWAELDSEWGYERAVALVKVSTLSADDPAAPIFGYTNFDETVFGLDFAKELAIPGSNVYLAMTPESFDADGVHYDIPDYRIDFGAYFAGYYGGGEFAPIVGIQQLAPGTTTILPDAPGYNYFIFRAVTNDPKLQAAINGVPGIQGVETSPYPPPPPPPPPPPVEDPGDSDPTDPGTSDPSDPSAPDPSDPGDNGGTTPEGGNQGDPTNGDLEKKWENLGKQIDKIGEELRDWRPPGFLRHFYPAAIGLGLKFAWDNYVGSAFALASLTQDAGALWGSVIAAIKYGGPAWNDVADELHDIVRDARSYFVPGWIPSKFVDPIQSFIDAEVDNLVNRWRATV